MIYNTYFSPLGLQNALGVLPNYGLLPDLGRLDDYGVYSFVPTSLFLNNEQGLWYDPSDLTVEKTRWRRNLLTYSQDFENAAWTKSNASLLSNLALYSQDFDNAAWTKNNTTVTANNATAPDGTTTADTLTGSTINNYISSTAATVPASTAHTASVYIKAGTSTLTRFSVFDSALAVTIAEVVITWTSGIPSINSQTGWSATPTFTDVGSGWYRVVGTFSTGVYTSIRLLYYPDRNLTSATSLLWGAQLVVGSTAQTYTRSLATAAPVQFSDPLGGTAADKLVENTATAQHFVFAPNPTLVSGYPYAVSAYLKAGEETLASIVRLADSAGAEFNLSAGTVGNIAAGMTASITAVGDGWYRCVVVMLGSGSTIGIQLRGRAVSYAGNGINGIYIYGAQVEQASTASAYQRITDFNSDFLAAFPTHALYQDSTFVTPVTALGQSVGGVIDKRLGGIAGATAFSTNNDFASGSTGWSPQSGWTITTGQASVNSAVAGSTYLRTTAATVTNAMYRIRFTVSNYTSGTLSAAAGGGTVGTVQAVGTYTFLINATSTAGAGVYAVGTNTVATVTNITVEAVPGNHAIQATSTSRPTLQARANLLTYSEQFDNAAWTKLAASVTANTTTAPDGTTTADKVVESATTNTHYVYQTPTLSAVQYTLSAYVKAAERSIVMLNVFVAATNYYAYFNLSNGTVGTTVNSTARIADAGNGWYRCSITFTSAAGASDMGVRPCIVDNNSSYAGDGTSGLFVWGAQLEQSATATTYQRIVTATDYADVGLPRNLLFDGTDDSLATVGNVDFATWTGTEARRNLLTMPTMFDDAAWVKTNSTVTANTTTAPDGTTTADAFVENTATGVHQTYQLVNWVNGVTYTASFYAKQGSGTRRLNVTLYAPAFTVEKYATFNLSTVSVATSVGVTGSIESVGNGWYRCRVTATATATVNDGLGIRLANGDAADFYSYTGDGTSSLFLWGAQLETGSTATAFQNVGVSAVTGFFGVAKVSDAAVGEVVSIGATTDANYASLLDAPRSAATANYGATLRSSGQAYDVFSASSYAAPVTNVVTTSLNYNGTTNATRGNLRVNTSEAGLTYTSASPVGTFTNALVYVGRRSNSTVPFNGRIFQLIVTGQLVGAPVPVEQWVASRTGVTL